MFDKQDIAHLREMFETYRKDTVVEIRDEMNSCIAASEARLRRGIVSDITDFIDHAIVPQINDLHAEDARIRRFVGMA